MVSKFKIVKSKTGFKLIQIRRDVFTGQKAKIVNLGSFRTLKEARKTQAIARKLIK